MNAIGSRLARLLVLLTVTPRVAACGSDEGDSTNTGVVAPPVTVPAGSTAAFTATATAAAFAPITFEGVGIDLVRWGRVALRAGLRRRPAWRWCQHLARFRERRHAARHALGNRRGGPTGDAVAWRDGQLLRRVGPSHAARGGGRSGWSRALGCGAREPRHRRAAGHDRRDGQGRRHLGLRRVPRAHDCVEARVGAAGDRQLDALNAATICNMLAEIDRTLSRNGTKASSRGARAQAAALQPNVVRFSRSTVLPIEGGQRIAVPPNCGHAPLFRQQGRAYPRASFASAWQRRAADLVQ